VGDSGFSLAEVALSLAIVAAILGAMVPSFIGLRAAEQARLTRSTMDGIMKAVGAYVQAYGCLPCPSPRSSIETVGFGLVRGDTTSSPPFCGGMCSASNGFVPFRSLGLPVSMARDGYGRFLTYAVDTTLTQAFNVVPPTAPCKTGDAAPCTADDITNGTRRKGLCQTGLSAANRLKVYRQNIALPETVAVVLVSHGANGRGAYTNAEASASRAPIATTPACSPGNSGPELCNADNDVNFFDAMAIASGEDQFDDQLLYLDRNALVASLGSGACGTTW
jgi:type II secretory pathway pseudopilin PulG